MTEARAGEAGVMIERLNSYDWKSAFEYAGEPGPDGEANLTGAVPGTEYDLTPFTREDVAELVAADEGENDERNWLCYGRLNDGRWFFLDAGCDYTGWDCQAWGTTTIAKSREECEQFALHDDARLRLMTNA